MGSRFQALGWRSAGMCAGSSRNSICNLHCPQPHSTGAAACAASFSLQTSESEGRTDWRGRGPHPAGRRPSPWPATRRPRWRSRSASPTASAAARAPAAHAPPVHEPILLVCRMLALIRLKSQCLHCILGRGRRHSAVTEKPAVCCRVCHTRFTAVQCTFST
jgi:hypothetical protein